LTQVGHYTATGVTTVSVKSVTYLLLKGGRSTCW